MSGVRQTAVHNDASEGVLIGLIQTESLVEGDVAAVCGVFIGTDPSPSFDMQDQDWRRVYNLGTLGAAPTRATTTAIIFR